MESSSATAEASTMQSATAEAAAPEAAGAADARESMIALHARRVSILDAAERAMAACRFCWTR